MHITDSLSITELPLDCIIDCSATGRDVYPEVSHWVDKLSISVYMVKAKEHLLDSGGWEKKEVDKMSDRDVAIKILWMACCTFKEFMTECSRKGVDPFNVPEGFDANNGSDVYFL